MSRSGRTRTLVVGASQAGLQLAASLRELDPIGAVTLVGAEARIPYQRPPLSKSFLSGEASEESLGLRGADFFASRGIELLVGQRIESIALDPSRRGGGEARTASGVVLDFDRLALTVGGSPRRLVVPGVGLDGVHYLRDVDDALALRRDLRRAQRVVVVGGGFLGLEAAAGAAAAGKQVTVVEVGDRLLGRTAAPVVSDFFLGAHRRRGVDVRLGVGVEAILGTDAVAGVLLTDGRRLEADVVVVAIGLAPRTGLAEQLGLACADGIVVDEAARTSNPAVVAAGDCTTTVIPGLGSTRLESVHNAVAQAKVAAATLAGHPAPAAAVPWFWSDQADLKLQSAGLQHGHDHVVVRGDPAAESFSVLYYRAGTLVAIDAVNAARDFMAVRRLLESGRSVPAEVVTDVSVALRQFVAAQA